MVNIPEDRLKFRFSRSSGPGGQNVNKVNTRITVFFDVKNCEEFTESQKRRILEKLHTRASKQGVVRVSSQKHRSQKQNRDAAMEKLRELLDDALRRKPKRRKTRKPKWAKEKRLAEKKLRSKLKQQRGKVDHRVSAE